MTYSIVARDERTGEIGVAVQSRSFRTGGVVPWARAGIGAVATQSFSEPAYGPRLLDALAEGAEPGVTLAGLVAEDRLRDFRQVAVLTADGRTAAHTGAACISATGCIEGAGYSAQGNMLASDEVVPALATAFERATGSLAERLLAGLQGAEAAGGDFRGREAGGILVVTGDPADEPLRRVSDLRVESHPDPLGELDRLLRIEQGLRRLRRSAPEDLPGELERAREAGVDDQVARWVAATSLLEVDPGGAHELLAPLIVEDPRWAAALDTAAALLAIEASS